MYYKLFFGNFLKFLQLSWQQLQNANIVQNLRGHALKCPIASDVMALILLSTPRNQNIYIGLSTEMPQGLANIFCLWKYMWN